MYKSSRDSLIVQVEQLTMYYQDLLHDTIQVQRCRHANILYIGTLWIVPLYLLSRFGIIDFEIYSPFLDSLHDPRCYALPSHPLRSLVTPHHQDLRTTHKPNVSWPTPFDITVTMGCYGFSCNKLVITRRQAQYTRYWHCMMSELSDIMALELWRHTVPIIGVWRMLLCNWGKRSEPHTCG